MSDILWDSPASLMRVTEFATAEAEEDLVSRGTVRELVATVLDMTPEDQAGLMIRVTDADDAYEYDADTIRELAARPEFTGAVGDWDTAEPGRAAEGARETAEVSHEGPTGTHPDPLRKPEETL